MHACSARCTWPRVWTLILVCVACAVGFSDGAAVEKEVTVGADFASRPTFLDAETIRMLPKELASSMIETKESLAAPPRRHDPLHEQRAPRDTDGSPMPARQRVHFTKRVQVAEPRFRSAPTPVRSDDLPSFKSSSESLAQRTNNRNRGERISADGAINRRRNFFEKARFRSRRTDSRDAPDFRAAHDEDDVSHHAVADQSEVTPLRRMGHAAGHASVGSVEAQHRDAMHDQMMNQLSEDAEAASEDGASENGASASEAAAESVDESSTSVAESSEDVSAAATENDESAGEHDEGDVLNAQLGAEESAAAFQSFQEHSQVVGGANYESQYDEDDDEMTPAQLAMDQMHAAQRAQGAANPRFMQTNSLPYGDAPMDYNGRASSHGLFQPQQMARDDPLTDGAGNRGRPEEGHFRSPRFRSASSSRIVQGIMFARQQRAAQRRLANGRGQPADAQMNEPANPDMNPMMASPMAMQQQQGYPQMGGMDGGMMPGAPMSMAGGPGAAGMDPRMMGAAPGMPPMMGMPQLNLPNVPPSLDDTAEPLMLEQDASVYPSSRHRHRSEGPPIADRVGENMRFSEVDSASAAFDDAPAGGSRGGFNSLPPGPRRISRVRDPSIPDAPAMEPSPPDPTELNHAPRMTPGGLPEDVYTPPHVVM